MGWDLGNLILVSVETLGRSRTLWKSHLAPTANGQIIIKVLSMVPLSDLKIRWKGSLANQQMFMNPKRCAHGADLPIAEPALNYPLLSPENRDCLAVWKNYTAC